MADGKDCTREDYEKAVCGFFAKSSGISRGEIGLDTRIVDLDLDSLDKIEIVLELVNQYDLGEIPDRDASQLYREESTVREMVDYIEKRVRRKQQPPSD